MHAPRLSAALLLAAMACNPWAGSDRVVMVQEPGDEPVTELELELEGSAEEEPGREVRRAAPSQASGSAEPQEPQEPEEPRFRKADLQAIAAVARDHQSDATRCHGLAKARNPAVGGRVTVQLSVDGGRVSAASVTDDTTGDSELAACIVRQVRRWRFPSDAHGTTTWPFVFR